MKIYSYMLAITMALLVSMPSHAAEVPADQDDAGDLVDIDEAFNTDDNSSGEPESESGSDNPEEPESESGSDNPEEPESKSDNDLVDFDEPVSESDIGDSIDVSDSGSVVVNEPVHFDDSVGFNNGDDEAQWLATPIPGAIWLFCTGLLGLSSIVKPQKML
jgi:hypothetical protein